MENIFGTYYNSSLDSSSKLPDNESYLKEENIFSYESDEAQSLSKEFRNKIANGESVFLLGFQSLAHNSGIALVEASQREGIKVVANYEEERFCGHKHFAGYPEKCVVEIKELLRRLGKTTTDIFCILYGWDIAKAEKNDLKSVMSHKKITGNQLYLYLSHSVSSQIEDGSDLKRKNFYIASPLLVQLYKRLVKDLNAGKLLPCVQMLHHENHAYFSYGASPFCKELSQDPVMISCIDGNGDLGSASLFLARGTEIQVFKRMPSTDSLGVFYMLCACFLGGWTALSAEGRYMGAAAWGNCNRLTNTFYRRLRQYFYFADNGTLRTNSSMTVGEYSVVQDIMGQFLPIEKLWNPDVVLNVDNIEHSQITRERVDKAAAVQMVFEDALFHIVGHFIEQTQSDKLVLCGGTALNCVANMRLLEHFNRDYYKRYFNKDTQLHIWTPPIPSDQGVVIGAPYQFAMRNGVKPQGCLPTPFLCGLSPSTSRIQKVLKETDYIIYEECGNISDEVSRQQLADWMAYIVSQNGVVGIYQGEAETGPRALGHRTFLANPCNPDTLDILNSRVKLRERIRPLAPMMTLEDAKKWFELSPGAVGNNYDAYNYMVLTVKAKPEAKKIIPAVIHYDNTSRIQIVRSQNNLLVYDYLKELKKYIGVEVSVNTSLNVAGPIVQHPEQVVEIFKRAKGLDVIFMVGDSGAVFMVQAKDGVQKYPSRIAELQESYKQRSMSTILQPISSSCKWTNEKEILVALQAKQISSYEAQQKLRKILDEKRSLPNQHKQAKVVPTQHNSSSASDIAKSIAIIGISGRFPDAENVEQFWDNLQKGRCSIKEVPSERGWDIDEYFDSCPQTPGKTYAKRGGFLDDIDKFDPSFFNISPRDAELMDPSERIFLQETWKAIEDAGYSATEISGQNWGVFACAKGDYSSYIQKQHETYFSPTDSFAAARVSYLLNLVGPAMSVDTACSSTLSAIAYACDSLILGNCEVAIAGGGGVYATPNILITSSQSLLLSPDEQCYTFDKRANGTVVAESISVVLLKPLQQAIIDRDHIYGVIKGWGTNQDGKTNGITAPSVKSQIQLMTNIYNKFSINPEKITMVEAHGTGTKLGDPIEFQGLSAAFQKFTSKTDYCALGSSKTNIGHAFFGAGITGLIKVLLSLKYSQIPPSLNFEEKNPYIALENSPFFINKSLIPWESKVHERYAAISSMGATGINAHLVISEHINANVATGVNYPAIIILSAKNNERLKEKAKQFLNAIQHQQFTDNDLPSIAYTLQMGREAMEERFATIVKSIAELKCKLEEFIHEQSSELLYLGRIKRNEDLLSALTLDEDMEVLINTWISKEKYSQLLKFWVKGLNVNWEKLYPKNKPYRISLPTYPFAKERYWLVANNKSESKNHHRKKELQKREDSEVQAKTSSVENVCENLVGNIALTPLWDIISIKKQPSSKFTKETILIGGDKKYQEYLKKLCPQLTILTIQTKDSVDIIAKKLAHEQPISNILWIVPSKLPQSITKEKLLTDQAQGVLQGFRLIKALLLLGYDKKSLIWNIITTQAQPILGSDRIDPTHASIHGLFGSMAKEYHNWQVRLIDADTHDNIPITDIFHLHSDLQGNSLGYRNKQWYQQKLFPLEFATTKQQAYKQGGVYVVIGGAGGIGIVWSEYMIQTYRAHIIWIGRRKKDSHIESELKRLTVMGVEPTYIEADARDRESLQKAYEKIKKKYRQINGLIHSAIVLSDQSIANMDVDQFEDSLKAKVDISVRMAQVFYRESLDFVMFFSSMIAFAKAPGQSNYVAGCTFKDAFAHYLSKEWTCAVKVINWGYWGSVGVVASESYQKRMAELGIGSIEHADAMEVLEKFIVSPIVQMGFTKITKPLSMDGINSSECIIVQEQQIPSISIKKYCDKKGDAQVKEMKQEIESNSREINTFLYELLMGQLQSIGLFVDKKMSIATLMEKLSNDGLYNRWLRESFAILSEQGYIGYDENFCYRKSEINIDKIWKNWDEKKKQWLSHPNKKSQILLVDTTLRALPDILMGKKLATDVLFPDASMKLVEKIYKNKISDYFNEVLTNVLVNCIKDQLSCNPSAKIRILEIGAGTGGTSATVFSKLQPYHDNITEYCYTDISNAFLVHAKNTYGSKNPFLTYRIFDVESPIDGQEIDFGQYDFVIATNVLHATKNIRQTLGNVKAPMKKNGLLLLNEMSKNSTFVHLTFGLLKGWWLYEDVELRLRGCPGLSSETWQMVLHDECFKQVIFPVPNAHSLGQQIIVAQNNGIVRRKQYVFPDVVSEPGNSEFATNTQQIQPIEVLQDSIKDTQQVIEQVVANIAKIPLSKIDIAASWDEMGIDSIVSMQMLREMESHFNIRMYPNELIEHSNIEKLALFLESEITKNKPLEHKQNKKPSVIYILSSPRSGSTLLRVMLGQHSQIFAPPELHLLPFSTMKQRAVALKQDNKAFLLEGLVKAICDLENISASQATKKVLSWEKEEVPIEFVYKYLGNSFAGKYVVDKSPSYAMDLSILSRAQEVNPDAFFIHLIRHPIAVMESFVRNRFDKIFAINEEDPWSYAGQLWYNFNNNIDCFLKNVKTNQKLTIHYEDLVSKPQQIAENICSCLGIDFEDGILEPYQSKKASEGLHSVSIPLGDPNFSSHNKIESEYATVWQKHLNKADNLKPNALQLAKKYNYDFGNDKHPLLPAQESFLRLFAEDPVWHIVQSLEFQIDHKLNIDLLQQCLQKIILRHVALQQKFIKIEDVWYQKKCFRNIDIEFKKSSPQIAISRKAMIKRLNDTLDISNGTTIASGVLEIGEKQNKHTYEIILIAHHLISDGVSMAQIWRELFDYYQDHKKIVRSTSEDQRVHKYLNEVRSYCTANVLQKHLSFWNVHISPQNMKIPTDKKPKSKKANTILSQQEYHIKIPYPQLEKHNKQFKQNAFATLATALYFCISQWANTDTPVVSHRIHRRNIGDEDYNDVVGWFAGDIPLKLKVSSFKKTMLKFKNDLKKIPIGGISYEILANNKECPAVYEVTPVRLNYQPGGPMTSNVKLETSLFESNNHDRLYLLDFIVRMRQNECYFIVRYSKNYHKKDTIKKLVERWLEIIIKS